MNSDGKTYTIQSLLQQTTQVYNYHMKFSNQHKKRPSCDREAPSRVLLVCVYDTIVIDITNEVIFARFSTFGPIVKILIFERGDVTKFFLEFTFVESAEQARKALDGSKLYSTICKMSIYYSTFESVDLKHETSEGILVENYPLHLSPGELDASFEPCKLDNIHCFFNSYFTETAFCLANDQKQELLDDYCEDNGHILSERCNHINISTQQLQKTIQKDINCLLDSPLKVQKDRLISDQQIKNNESDYYLCFIIEHEINNRKVYNLFSNFGNIVFIKRTKRDLLIKFRNREYAAMARNYLQGFALQGNSLKFNKIKREILEMSEEQCCEITHYNHTFDRFTALKSITINPPSQTLHVSSLKKQICNSEDLRHIFEFYGCVDKIQILSQSNEKNMALIKFISIEDSFNAMASMHNSSMSGRRIQISFTKSRLL